jgi:hypothetical protein
MSAAFGTDGHTQTGKTCADDQYIRINNFHLVDLLDPS